MVLEEVEVPDGEDYQVQEEENWHEPEEPFAGFVVEDDHAPECPQRAEERRNDEGFLGDAPLVSPRPAFVDAEEQERDDVAGEPDEEDEGDGQESHR